ncbi:MAG: AAA family ATPase [Cyanobacteria bacterium CRU_2_1]|nr:AAA family ATPase [Cyanobacteria bacterium RU_5_0]NJR57721.1 AAA family ATPase [Cyanobacteria bacterium CRU_2_1]
MYFNIKEAIKVANQVMLTNVERHLTDVEIAVLAGAWEREEYDQIAAKHQYATSYISQDVAPKLWKTLSDALGEKVKKSNFKEALKRCWEKQKLVDDQSAQPKIIGSDRFKHAEKFLQIDIYRIQAEAIGSDRYIERPPIESLCYETLLQPGSLIRIKAPTLMGKTFLMNRLLSQLDAQNYRTVSLSLELADRKTHLTNLDKFLRWFCINLSRELRMPNQLEDYWDEEGMGSKVSCTTYLEEYLLAESDRPLVICLDDVDLLFAYPEIYEDVFGLLRSWYEKARSRQNWKKLRLVIVHATDVYIQLNLHQSPFNVGLPIELPEFTLEQGKAFAKQHGLDDTEIVEPLVNLLGGHPYLLEQAFSHLKIHPDLSLPKFLTTAPTDAGIYANHLRQSWLTLQQQPALYAALKTVMVANKPVQLEPIQAYQLQRMGLIMLSGNQAVPRCDLYRQYFQSRPQEEE